MRRFSLFLLIACLAAPAASAIELGIILGEPTGLSAKRWLTETTAVDAAAAWSFKGRDSFHLHADFLRHRFDLFETEAGQLPLYYGIGGRVRFEEVDTRVGLRLPVGLEHRFDGEPRLTSFLEFVPMLNLAPNTTFSLQAGLGVRYRF